MIKELQKENSILKGKINKPQTDLSNSNELLKDIPEPKFSLPPNKMQNKYLFDYENGFFFPPIYVEKNNLAITKAKEQLRGIIKHHREMHPDDNAEYLIMDTEFHECKEHEGKIQIYIARFVMKDHETGNHENESLENKLMNQILPNQPIAFTLIHEIAEGKFFISPFVIKKDKELVAQKKKEIRWLIDAYRRFFHTWDNSEYVVLVKNIEGDDERVQIHVATIEQPI